jgi:crossover junction endodeoxyribonuclease RusA
MEIAVPIEFIVSGTPVSANSRNKTSRRDWIERVKAAASSQLPSPHFASEAVMEVVLYYFPSDDLIGDLDNIIKLILDALRRHVYIDDVQVERIIVQRVGAEQAIDQAIERSAMLQSAIKTTPPLVYVRISDNPSMEVL